MSHRRRKSTGILRTAILLEAQMRWFFEGAMSNTEMIRIGKSLHKLLANTP